MQHADPYHNIILSTITCSTVHHNMGFSCNIAIYLSSLAPASMLKVDRPHFQECILDMLTQMFGEESVGNRMGDQITISVNNITATVNLNTMVSFNVRSHVLTCHVFTYLLI